DINRIIFLNQVVICGIGKCQCQHALFLQVGLMNPRKRFYQDSTDAQEPWLHRSMFPGRTFSVVFVTYYNRTYLVLLVLSLYDRNFTVCWSYLVFDFVGFVVAVVYITD